MCFRGFITRSNYSMTKVTHILLVLFLIVGCTKKTIILDGEPTEDFDLPLILNLNGKDCFYDHELGILKYPLSSGELQGFQALVKFQSQAEVLFNNQINLQNNQVNSLIYFL